MPRRVRRDWTSQVACAPPNECQPSEEGRFGRRRRRTTSLRSRGGFRMSKLLAVALAAAALPVSGAQAATPPLFPVTIQAANGPVTIAKRPTRIVSLSPTATEDLYAVGAGSQVAAVDDNSNFPTNAPKTTLSSFRPNAEAISTYDPDLVIVGFDGGIVSQLQKLGLTVLYQPAAANLGDAYREILDL